MLMPNRPSYRALAYEPERTEIEQAGKGDANNLFPLVCSLTHLHVFFWNNHTKCSKQAPPSLDSARGRSGISGEAACSIQ